MHLFARSALRAGLTTIVALASVFVVLNDRESAPARAAVASAQRPNVVLVLADDMRADDLRFVPSIRRLIGARGITFKNSFSPYPLCCPARASLLSGQYAHNHHVFSNELPYGFSAFHDRRTLATSLHHAGYHTAFVGKYLNNYGKVKSPTTHRASFRYVPPGWDRWYGAVGRPRHSRYHGGGPYQYFHTIFNVNGHIDDSHRGQYQTNVLGAFARRAVRSFSGSSDPFFLFVSFVAPHYGGPHERDDRATVAHDARGHRVHLPTPARPRWVKGRFARTVHRSPGLPVDGSPSERRIGDKPRYVRHRLELTASERRAEAEVTRQRAEALTVLDHEVRRLVVTLRRKHELANTVFLFTSDNGYFLGEHRLLLGKVKPYEPSLRVPLLAAGPGIPHGVRHDPAMTPDITATILDLAGAKPPHAPDGGSLVPTFSADVGWTAPVVTEAILGSHRYRHAHHRHRRGFDDVRTSIGIRTARWKLVHYSTGEVELYDLNHDPNELRNLAGRRAYTSVQAELTRVWWQYKDCAGAACSTQMPVDLVESPTALASTTREQVRRVRARYGVTF